MPSLVVPKFEINKIKKKKEEKMSIYIYLSIYLSIYIYIYILIHDLNLPKRNKDWAG